MSVELELRGVRVRYGPLEALHGVDLVVPAGRLTVLLGHNGAGRSTALRTLAGLVTPGAGRVLWRGEDVTRLPALHRARRGMALVPDERAVFPSLTVAEHLALRPAASPPVFPALRALTDRPAGVLSGGEQRQLALAGALGSGARVLLLDEPGRGLSAAAAETLRGAVRDAVREGRTVLVAEQLPGTLAADAAVVHVLHRGRVVFTGEPGEPGLTRLRAAGPGRSGGGEQGRRA